MRCGYISSLQFGINSTGKSRIQATQMTSKNLIHKILDVFVGKRLARFDYLVQIGWANVIQDSIDWNSESETERTFHRLKISWEPSGK